MNLFMSDLSRTDVGNSTLRADCSGNEMRQGALRVVKRASGGRRGVDGGHLRGGVWVAHAGRGARVQDGSFPRYPVGLADAVVAVAGTAVGAGDVALD